jgi:hypothetical protein
LRFGGELGNVSEERTKFRFAKRLANNLANKLYQKGGKKQLLTGRCKLEARKKKQFWAIVGLKLGKFGEKQGAFSVLAARFLKRRAIKSD